MTDSATFQSRDTLVVSGITVRHFRQIVLWPLQLIPLRDDVQIHRHWDFLAQLGPSNPWHEVRDEFTGNPCDFQERHYAEFVNFLPHVQRVLYGEGKGVTDRANAPACESPIRVFRRSDVQGVRITLARDSVHRLHRPHRFFFFDLDVVIPARDLWRDSVWTAQAFCSASKAYRLIGKPWPGTGTARGASVARRTATCSPVPTTNDA